MEKTNDVCVLKDKFGIEYLQKVFLRFFDTCETSLSKISGKKPVEKFDFEMGKHKLTLKKGNIKYLKGFTTNGPLYNTNMVSSSGEDDRMPYGGFYQDSRWVTEYIRQETMLIEKAKKINFNLCGLGGVFILKKDNSVEILSNKDFEEKGMDTSDVQIAFQNGPILVKDFKIDDTFQGKGNQKYKYKRAAIGYGHSDKDVSIIYANEPLTMSKFAQYCKNVGLKDAIYLDGGLGRSTFNNKGVCQEAIRLADDSYKINICES